ncbi:MAG TPA: DMT family transporter [Stellaceae bacterium]|nr:DMT family transporter [Stellaceae bacterium]
MPEPSREEIRRGILYMVASVLVFATANAMVKYAEAVYPATEVVFFRCAFSLIPCLVLIASHGGFKVLRTRRLPEHIGRGVMQFLSTIAIFISFHLMPLADVAAITFSSPLFVTVLSIPALGEKVGPHRWAAVLLGFIGVLIMARPGAGSMSYGALLALANAALGASITIAMRRMTLTEPSITLVSYQAIVTTALSLIVLPLDWVTPDLFGALNLMAIGICSGVGQFLWTQAFRFAPAAVCAPFNYTSIIWAMGFGFFIWGDVPTPMLVFGAAVVASSGLYILYRETIRQASQRPNLATVRGH